jgi:predicted permease
MDTLIYAFNAVAPILILIALGYVLKRVMKLSERFFSELNNFCYRILLPVQLFHNVYKVERFSDINWRVIGYTMALIPVAILIGIILAKPLIADKKQKGAFIQAAFRSNQAIMGLPLAISLGGDEAAVIASIATSIGIPIFNVSAVIILNAFSEKKAKESNLKRIFLGLIKNPLIIGVTIGLLCVGVRYLLPEENGAPIFTIQGNLPFLYTVIGNLSSVASPVMLICLGACLDFKLTKSLVLKIAAGVSLRLIVIPAIAIGGALLLKSPLGVTHAEIPMLVAFFGSPVAVSSAILVRETGGDEQYASQLVIWSSALSILTLFTIIAILRETGYLLA